MEITEFVKEMDLGEMTISEFITTRLTEEYFIDRSEYKDLVNNTHKYMAYCFLSPLRKIAGDVENAPYHYYLEKNDQNLCKLNNRYYTWEILSAFKSSSNSSASESQNLSNNANQLKKRPVGQGKSIEDYTEELGKFTKTDKMRDYLTKWLEFIHNDKKITVSGIPEMAKRTFKYFYAKESKPVSRNEKELNITDLIEEGGCRQLIFTGAPGTGKTYLARKIAETTGGKLQNNSSESAGYEFVQFHPSYDYTDFVEGLRPVERNGAVCFVKTDGIFKDFCRRVIEQGNPEQRYYFIIDEINRANMSKVFGELMFCLEKDKRGEKNRVKNQYHLLKTYNPEKESYYGENGTKDVFAEGFYIPENVCVIGTMNDIDRSVDSMDFALRRRFEWIAFDVDKNMLLTALPECLPEGADAVKIADCVTALNSVIKDSGGQFGLNRDYFISQGQFANLPASVSGDTKEILDYVWKYRVELLLREYLRGEEPEQINAFITAAKGAFEQQ